MTDSNVSAAALLEQLATALNNARERVAAEPWRVDHKRAVSQLEGALMLTRAAMMDITDPLVQSRQLLTMKARA